jgi:hypothetical protein
VPHVRLTCLACPGKPWSVRGPNKKGEAHHSFCEIIFGPRPLTRGLMPLALPALKRVIRVETLSRSAKALLPPHKCGGSHLQARPRSYQRNPKVTGNVPTVPVPKEFPEVFGASTQR